MHSVQAYLLKSNVVLTGSIINDPNIRLHILRILLDHKNLYHIWKYIPLCGMWLSVDASSAAYASLGTESTSHRTSLPFLRPLQQLENSVHDFDFSCFYNFFMSSYFQSFPSTYKPFPGQSVTFGKHIIVGN